MEAKMMDKKPNLVFVFPDQFHQQSMGFLKQDPVITPNIDRFAHKRLDPCLCALVPCW
jgi:arylsulfatase A-like enzyme